MANPYMTGDEDHDESNEMHWSQRNNMMVAQTILAHCDAQQCCRDVKICLLGDMKV